MRTFIYFIATCFISTGVYFALLNGSQPAIGIAIALLMWVWFLWGYDRSLKKAARRKSHYLYH